MKLQELFPRIREGIRLFFTHFRILRPDMRSLTFMLLLFIVLGILIFINDQSQCVNCETGKCECETQSFIGFGLWIDLAAAALLSYIIITVIFIVLKKYKGLS